MGFFFVWLIKKKLKKRGNLETNLKKKPTKKF